MGKLKPCPFCGKEAYNRSWDTEKGADIYCKGCGLNLQIPEKEWNYRPIEDELRQRTEKAENSLAESGQELDCVKLDNERLKDGLRWRKYPDEKPESTGMYIIKSENGYYSLMHADKNMGFTNRCWKGWFFKIPEIKDGE